MRVLIVDDEELLAQAIHEAFRREIIAADIAYDGATALEMDSVNEYDVVVLDRDLPVIHGDRVCAELSAAGSRARVLMLTASGRLTDKVEGFRLGADDYLAKPFAFPELIARVRALGRRTAEATPVVYEYHGVRLDAFRHDVFRDGTYIRLSKKEFAILEVLMAADGATVSAERILEKAWDENVDPFTNSIRVTLSTLRKKLGQPGIIETVSGVGYRIAAPVE
ncbi:DNA-binding response regulator [Mycetocola lacteus]|uniref:DNA-binding response regulator n=1 Tax=Mycetocola lacteus TaxID=76637 RepID=A0A3L7AK67_9MICO|nr:response regulator transcription factor [Mycetocola lacteus]RLP80657.1 DNA-binding response regulator [Mycetocola lacteus]RLP84442.1 DNA-binding response regulator [Mycetocola lacteus]